MSNTSVKNVYINSAYRTSGVDGDFTITKPASTFSAIPKRIKLLSAQIPMTWKTIVSDNFIITNVNNQFQLIENCIVYTITITPGNYTSAALITAVQNALNAATPASNYLVTFNINTNLFTISNTTPIDFELNFNITNSMYKELGFNKTLYPIGSNIVTSINNMQTNIVVDATNNKFLLTNTGTAPAYGNYTVTIPSATYTTTTFAAAVQLALNTTDVNATYTVTFYGNENKLNYNIYSTGTFALNFAVANSAAALLGFNQILYPPFVNIITSTILVPDIIEIDNTNNNFNITRDFSLFNIIVPPNTYTRNSLANEIQSLIIAAGVPNDPLLCFISPSGYFRFTSNYSFHINFGVANSIAHKIGFDEQSYPPYQNNLRGSSTFPFMVNTTNNSFSLFEDCINSPITIPTGSYNYTTLAKQLQTLLNNVSSGFLVTVTNNKLTFTKDSNFQLNFAVANPAATLLGFGSNIYPNNTNTFTSPNTALIMSGNNSFIVTLNLIDYTVAIPTGWYSTATLATAVQTALNNVNNGNEMFTVSYTAASFKYTITHIVPPNTNFSMNFNVPNSIYSMLGFNKTIYSGAYVYDSVNVALIQNEPTLLIRSNLVGGLDNGIIPWFPNSNPTNILATIPITTTTTGNTIFYTSPDNEPWQDMRESNFSKILLPGDSTQVSMQFSLQFLNNTILDLNGSHWSANLLFEF